MSPVPFRQSPFESLPDAPRVPHGFFGLKERTVTVHSEHFGDTQVSVRSVGEGPPLLLVHGLMTTGYSFRYLYPKLAGRFTVYMPDLVGSGRSQKPDVSYGPAPYAAWIGELIDALEIGGCAVIGNSMGGYLCMRLAMQRPEVMSRLVNLHSPGVPVLRLYALNLAMRAPGSRGLLGWLVGRDPLRWAHRNVHYYDESLKSLEEAREVGLPLSVDAGVNAFARILEETLDPWEMRRFVARLRALDAFPVPLHLVYAARDPMVPPSVGARLRAILPDAEWSCIEQGSHFAHVDALDAFIGAVMPSLVAP